MLSCCAAKVTRGARVAVSTFSKKGARCSRSGWYRRHRTKACRASAQTSYRDSNEKDSNGIWKNYITLYT